jgi:hypothetical protein
VLPLIAFHHDATGIQAATSRRSRYAWPLQHREWLADFSRRKRFDLLRRDAVASRFHAARCLATNRRSFTDSALARWCRHQVSRR